MGKKYTARDSIKNYFKQNTLEIFSRVNSKSHIKKKYHSVFYSGAFTNHIFHNLIHIITIPL